MVHFKHFEKNKIFIDFNIDPNKNYLLSKVTYCMSWFRYNGNPINFFNTISFNIKTLNKKC